VAIIRNVGSTRWAAAIADGADLGRAVVEEAAPFAGDGLPARRALDQPERAEVTPARDDRRGRPVAATEEAFEEAEHSRSPRDAGRIDDRQHLERAAREQHRASGLAR